MLLNNIDFSEIYQNCHRTFSNTKKCNVSATLKVQRFRDTKMLRFPTPIVKWFPTPSLFCVIVTILCYRHYFALSSLFCIIVTILRYRWNEFATPKMWRFPTPIVKRICDTKKVTFSDTNSETNLRHQKYDVFRHQ